MKLKKEILKLCREDLNFKNEIKYLLEIDDIEDEMIKIKENFIKKKI